MKRPPGFWNSQRQGRYKKLDDGRYLCPVCGSIYSEPFALMSAKQCCQTTKDGDWAYPINQRCEKLDDGRYLCPACGKTYPERKLASACCEAEKSGQSTKYMGVLWEVQAIANKSPSVDKRETKHTRNPDNPHPGVRHPDQYGHWYRGKVFNQTQKEAQYSRAFSWIDRQARLGALQRLEGLYGSVFAGEPHIKENRRSPLQRMAYAFYRHDWESLKYAAFALANEYADRYLRTWLEDKTNEITQVIDELERELDDDTESPSGMS